jgi:hypothetical protein
MLKFCIMFFPDIDSENGVSIFDISAFWKGVEFVWSVNVIQIHGNRVRKRRRRQEYQELTSKMCSHNMESDPSTQTIMLHVRPSPIHVSEFVKLQFWCTTRPNNRFWSSISMTFLWSHTRGYVNMWHENDTGSLETTSCFMDALRSSHHYVCKYVTTRTFPRNFLLCLMQKYMNKTRHVTYVFSCSLQRKRDVSFAHCNTHYGHVCVWNMNICAVGCQSMLYQYLSSSKSCPVRLLQCHTTLLSSFERCCFWEHLNKHVYRWEIF